MNHQASRITTVSHMIDLRHLPTFQPEDPETKDYRNSWRKERTCAEERILEIVEVVYVLQADGFPLPEIFKRVGSVYGPAPSPVLDRSHDPLKSYLVNHLETHYAPYIKLSNGLLTATLALAELWAEIYAQRVAASDWPHADMLTRKIDGGVDTLDNPLEGQTPRDACRVKARAIPGDELHCYNTGALSWDLMMGSAGLALVRGGRSIDHIENIMN